MVTVVNSQQVPQDGPCGMERKVASLEKQRHERKERLLDSKHRGVDFSEFN